MSEQNDTSPEESTPDTEQQAPADALSRTPDDLEQEQAEKVAATATPEQAPEKKLSPIRRFFRRVNLYFLLFLLLIVIGGAITIVNYLNSQKVAPVPAIGSQTLSESALKQLATNDATVGNSSQTLTIQGNAIIAGQTLMRGNLNVAGSFQTGGTIQAPNLTISGTSNLGTAQINSLQVAQNAAIQGSTTMRDLSVSGASTFSGAVTANQLTVTRLVLSGNAVLQVPNHLAFTGPAPNRTNGNGLGNGGSASVSGSDTAGTVSINTGTNTAAGCFARINFAQAFATQPRVIVTPVGAAAGRTEYYVDRSATGFSICTSSPAPISQTFAFDYFVTG